MFMHKIDFTSLEDFPTFRYAIKVGSIGLGVRGYQFANLADRCPHSVTLKNGEGVSIPYNPERAWPHWYLIAPTRSGEISPPSYRWKTPPKIEGKDGVLTIYPPNRGKYLVVASMGKGKAHLVAKIVVQ